MSRNAVAFEVIEFEELKRPGAYRFLYNFLGIDERRVGIEHGCPCGCGGITALFFRGTRADGNPKWDVSGEWPKVTLSPSIGIKYDGAGNGPTLYHWHGYLENGVFVER